MTTLQRAILAVLGVIPLWAPYDLIIEPGWTDFLNPAFAFVALVALGATAVSLFLFYGAVAGLSTQITLDRARSQLVHTASAPVVRKRTRVFPLSSIERVDVRTHESGEGTTSYALRLTLSDGTTLESGTSWSREPVEAIESRVKAYLGV